MNMLDKKVKHKRLKDKAPKDPKYLRYLHNDLQPPCYVCNTFLGIQIHHVKLHSTDERDDRKVIPVCEVHHIGNKFSVHGTPIAFKEMHPMAEQEAFAEKLYLEYLNTKGE